MLFILWHIDKICIKVLLFQIIKILYIYFQSLKNPVLVFYRSSIPWHLGFYLEGACDNVCQLYTSVYREVCEEEIFSTCLCQTYMIAIGCCKTGKYQIL